MCVFLSVFAEPISQEEKRRHEPVASTAQSEYQCENEEKVSRGVELSFSLIAT